jgi:hypothetical protein
MVAHGLEVDQAAPTDVSSLRTHLEGRLTDLKCRVLKDFAEGGLMGEALVAGLVALINDTRKSQAGMVITWKGARQDPAQDKVEPI